MTKKSAEQSSGVGGWVAAGVIITTLTAGGKTHHDQAHKPHEHLKDPRNLTVDTRITAKQAEELFGCDIQDDMRPDRNGSRRASKREKECAKHIAFVIGKNTYGWGKSQQRALDALWTHESQWSANADNPHSSAYGIPQAMTSERLHGPELQREFGDGEYAYDKNPVSQIRWGLEYIHERYGNPANANDFWHRQCGGTNGCWY